MWTFEEPYRVFIKAVFPFIMICIIHTNTNTLIHTYIHTHKSAGVFSECMHATLNAF